MAQNIPSPLEGDDNGYQAWLNYAASGASLGRIDLPERTFLTVSGEAPDAALSEWRTAMRTLFGSECAFETNEAKYGLVYRIDPALASVSDEAYRICCEEDRIELRGASECALLYATFALLRQLCLGRVHCGMDLSSEPYYDIRMLDHWDDPKFDPTIGCYNVTRGFAGNSIFNWQDLAAEDPRYRDYARLLASIGINAVCINNVNADPDLIETGYLPGIAAMADRLRPYGIRLYLSVCFSAPMVTDGTPGEEEYGEGYPFNMRNRKVRLGTLDTADPRDPRVQKWWADKVAEIYEQIPDFGGFVIKANSEGMPGPQEYGLSHADGANCIARALAPHGGTLFWRTFVYGDTRTDVPDTDPHGDGCCQPYLEFTPLDGQFDGNVILQTKNGPADFRADEPPSPLLGAVPQTRQAVEFMAAQEYLGHTTHVCYQAEHWHNILNFDTHQQGSGSTVAAVTAGRHGGYQTGAIVAVANIGDDPNWFGHRLAGANLYAFGALAWDPARTAEAIAEEWTERTFGQDSEINATIGRILGESYGVFARYAAPLGLGNMHEPAHHYEPHKARMKPRFWNQTGAGFDRTVATGSQFLGQYHPDSAKAFETPESCPVRQLLFFHHLPWDYTMPDGRSLARYIAEDRTAAVEVIREWIADWRKLRDRLDPLTWAHVYERLNRQYVHAGKWRDEGLAALRDVGQPAKAAAKPSPRPEAAFA